jgi:hypothetical protein
MVEKISFEVVSGQEEQIQQKGVSLTMYMQIAQVFVIPLVLVLMIPGSLVSRTSKPIFYVKMERRRMANPRRDFAISRNLPTNALKHATPRAVTRKIKKRKQSVLQSLAFKSHAMKTSRAGIVNQPTVTITNFGTSVLKSAMCALNILGYLHLHLLCLPCPLHLLSQPLLLHQFRVKRTGNSSLN